MKKVLGVLGIAAGIGLLGWVGYNFLIEMQPEAERRNPIAPVLFSIALIYTGIKTVLRRPDPS
jgi:hypothetical protein